MNKHINKSQLIFLNLQYLFEFIFWVTLIFYLSSIDFLGYVTVRGVELVVVEWWCEDVYGKNVKEGWWLGKKKLWKNIVLREHDNIMVFFWSNGKNSIDPWWERINLSHVKLHILIYVWFTYVCNGLKIMVGVGLQWKSKVCGRTIAVLPIE
jgi:hypothetical protein